MNVAQISKVNRAAAALWSGAASKTSVFQLTVRPTASSHTIKRVPRALSSARGTASVWQVRPSVQVREFVLQATSHVLTTLAFQARGNSQNALIYLHAMKVHLFLAAVLI